MVRGHLAKWSRAELKHPLAKRTWFRTQRGSHFTISIALRPVANDAVSLVNIFTLRVTFEVPLPCPRDGRRQTNGAPNPH